MQDCITSLNLLNESFSQGIFPDRMKLALVTPVYKGKSKLEICNYRPVSILPILSKVLEKLMVDRVTVKWTYLFMNTSLNFKKKKKEKKNQPLLQFLIYTQIFLIP